MPRPVILDVHEWINEVLTVPGGIFAKPQTRERASGTQRGKKTLLSLTPAWDCRMMIVIKRTEEISQQCNTLALAIVLLTY